MDVKACPHQDILLVCYQARAPAQQAPIGRGRGRDSTLPAWMTSPEALPSLEHGHVSNIITSANKLTAILSNFRRAIAQQTIATLENALHMHARKQGTISMNILCRTTYRSRGRFRTVLARQPWPRIHLQVTFGTQRSGYLPCRSCVQRPFP